LENRDGEIGSATRGRGMGSNRVAIDPIDLVDVDERVAVEERGPKPLYQRQR